MKVFISWSGERSRRVAEVLRDWLPDVIQGINPWMSKADIEAGARWNREIDVELSSTAFGILCLTKTNQNSPWLVFEAGALAKSLPDSFVCPYLIDLDPTDLHSGPLTQFQQKRATELETWELIVSLNRSFKEHSLPEERLRRSFDKFWPDLANALGNLPPELSATPAKRAFEDMVEETLEIVRGLARRGEVKPWPPRLSTDPVRAIPVQYVIKEKPQGVLLVDDPPIMTAEEYQELLQAKHAQGPASLIDPDASEQTDG